MKTCSCCKQSKPFAEFNKNKANKDGLQYQCKVCTKEANAKSFKKISDEVRQRRVASARVWKENNKDKVVAYRKNYRKENQAYFTNKQIIREKAKLQRVPIWVDDEEKFLIEEVYHLAKLREQATGIKWHVDHIVPLQGKTVSGLHTINNLQVITAKENLRKHNIYGE
jgi:5-methylcytosine-specific restriction endonuclease McrA